MPGIEERDDLRPDDQRRPADLTLSYKYNLDGSLARLHYPSGAVVAYTPDSAGRALSAVDTANGTNYVTGATYGPDSSLTGFVSGSGGAASITNSFSYNKRLQPVTMSASTATQTVFSIGYDFHAGNGTAGSGSDNGNVWGIYNYRDRNRDQSFTYDALNRLSSAQSAGTDCTQKRSIPMGSVDAKLPPCALITVAILAPTGGSAAKAASFVPGRSRINCVSSKAALVSAFPFTGSDARKVTTPAGSNPRLERSAAAKLREMRPVTVSNTNTNRHLSDQQNGWPLDAGLAWRVF